MSVVLLKGVNVGKGNRIDSKELARTASRETGIEFRSLLASGNLVSQVDVEKKQLSRVIAQALADRGVSVDVIIFDSIDFLQIMEAVSTLTFQDSARALVYFTNDRVNPEGLATIKSLKTQEDVVIRMNSIFVDYKEGVSASKIDTKAIDRSFGIRSTGRNMNTLLKLRALS